MQLKIKQDVQAFRKIYDSAGLDTKMKDPRVKADFYYYNLLFAIIVGLVLCLLALIGLVGTYAPFSNGYILPQINATTAYLTIFAVNLVFLTRFVAEMKRFDRTPQATKRAACLFNWFTGIDMVMATLSFFSTQADSSFFFEYILITSIVYLVPNAPVRTQVRNTAINLVSVVLILSLSHHHISWQDIVDLAALHIICGWINQFRLLNFLRTEKAKFALEQKRDEFYQDSRTDGLTGLLNRTALRSDFPNWVGQRLCVALVDLDDFKHYNDTKGHVYGDAVLMQTSDSMRRVFCAETDRCYRYGGDEFLVISAEPDKARFRKKLMAFKQDGAEGQSGINVTFSIGWDTGTPQSEQALRDLIRAADAHLYRAKRDGEDGIVGITSEKA